MENSFSGYTYPDDPTGLLRYLTAQGNSTQLLFREWGRHSGQGPNRWDMAAFPRRNVIVTACEGIGIGEYTHSLVRLREGRE
jgi:hypothetical protein